MTWKSTISRLAAAMPAFILCCWPGVLMGELDPSASRTIEISISTRTVEERLPDGLAQRFSQVVEALESGDTSEIVAFFTEQARSPIAGGSVSYKLEEFSILFVRQENSQGEDGTVSRRIVDVVVQYVRANSLGGGSVGVGISSWVKESEKVGWVCTDLGFGG